jgi:hypothetical protein
MDNASSLLVGSFASLGLLVASTFPVGLYWASRRLGHTTREALRVALLAGAGTVLWLIFTLGAAARGALAFTGRPPTMVLLLVAMAVLAIGVGLSWLGERLAMGIPLAALVGVQGFRLPLELMLHRAYEEGLMPVQMSYTGFNFDIVTGTTAIIMAGLLFAGRMPLWGVRVWNWMGFGLLVNVVTIAFLSAPTPVRVFTNEPANVWILQPPFVWLPTVLVFAALLGHIVIFRRLRAEKRGGTFSGGVRRGENTGGVVEPSNRASRTTSAE